jgi:Family of unknown function (DUF6308)
VRVGDLEVRREAGLGQLRDYASKHHQTVQFYDLGGDLSGRPGPGGGSDPVNEVTLTDIGRLVAFGARLAADDVGKLMGPSVAAALAAVPATARLEDCEPGTDLHRATTALNDSFRDGGIWRAKRSKLMHLKRPWLVPVADPRVQMAYRNRVQGSAAVPGEPDPVWPAVRADLRDGADDLAWMAAQLVLDEDPLVQRLGRLTTLRLLDILARAAVRAVPAGPQLHGLQAALQSLDRPRKPPSRR